MPGARDKRPKVVYWNNIPAPYMVDRFNALVDRGNIELTVWFSQRTEPDREWRVDETDWRFPYRYLPRAEFLGRGLALPIGLVSDRTADLLISLYGAPEFAIGWAAAVLLGWRTAFWSEVTFESWVRRRPHREWLKRRMFRRVDGVITAGEDGVAFARRYGAGSDRIHIVRHAVDGPFYAQRVQAEHADRTALREKLGLRGTVFLYAGRLWEPKGIFDLINAYALVRENGVDSTLVIVGSGRDEAAVRAAARTIESVVFAGFVQREDMPPWYAAADVFVFPTLGDPYGMVVDEAMAAGLPVISTTAAGEIRSRVDGDVGLLVPPGSPSELATAMSELAVNPRRAQGMGRAASVRMASVGPDRWAIEFENAVLRMLASSAEGHHPEPRSCP